MQLIGMSNPMLTVLGSSQTLSQMGFEIPSCNALSFAGSGSNVRWAMGSPATENSNYVPYLTDFQINQPGPYMPVVASQAAELEFISIGAPGLLSVYVWY